MQERRGLRESTPTPSKTPPWLGVEEGPSLGIPDATNRKTAPPIVVAAVDIMSITGHTKEATFLRHIKVTPRERAKRMALRAFFS
tara:strand:+ start:1388 stop:1642 length:255 start_codon:yes stop_codon:yes gene_type:complete